MKTRVFLVEDDPGLRARLAATLARCDDLDLVAACDTVAAALSALDAREPELDVALVDLGLPDGSGVEVLRKLRATRPDADAIVITVFDDARTVLKAIEAGARGYVLKGWTDEQIVSALREAAAGGAPMTPRIARLVLDALSARRRDERDVEALTAREVEVLNLLCEGRTYREVAHALGIALGTVQTHVKAIYAKLEVCSKAELTAAAFRRGLVK
jgi:DNA-binding NarL/FixJ family response regulator